jgi:hypothetical protein
MDRTAYEQRADPASPQPSKADTPYGNLVTVRKGTAGISYARNGPYEVMDISDGPLSM